MAIPIPYGKHINISAHIHRFQHYNMPSMQMATDHYNIGFVLSGDRRTITPLETYCYHAGDVAMAPPYFFHRTIAETDTPYNNILIKFTPDYIEPFIKIIGQSVFDDLYKTRVCRFNPESQDKIKNMFFEMFEEFKKDKPYKELILQGMLFRLFTTILEERLPTNDVKMNKSPLTTPVMDALYHIESYYNQNPTLEELAKIANLSAAYFSRLFHAQLGMSCSEYINNVKLRHVQTMLEQTDKSIMDIALETGYCHGDYLSAQFKKKIGISPTEFRKKIKKK